MIARENDGQNQLGQANSARPFFMFFSGRVVRNIAKFFGQLGHHQN
jgi:hypothetical protein